MGEAKKKSVQIFKFTLGGKQRHAIYQAFYVHNPKDREDRKRQIRAAESLKLSDFSEMTPELDEKGQVTVKAMKEFNAKIVDSMSATVTLTYENVEAVLSAIKWCFESGMQTPGATETYSPIEDLMEECKSGKHQADPEEDKPAPAPAPTGEAGE